MAMEEERGFGHGSPIGGGSLRVVALFAVVVVAVSVPFAMGDRSSGSGAKGTGDVANVGPVAVASPQTPPVEPPERPTVDAALGPSGDRAYVVRSDLPWVEVRRLPAGDVVRTVSLPFPAEKIAHAGGQGRMYALASGAATLYELSGEGFRTVRSVALPASASNFAILPGKDRAVVALGDAIAVVDLATGLETVRRSFEYVHGGLATSPEGHVYFGGGDDLFGVTVLDENLDTVRRFGDSLPSRLSFTDGAVVGTVGFSTEAVWIDASTLVSRTIQPVTGASDAVYDPGSGAMHVLDSTGTAVASYAVDDEAPLGFAFVEPSVRLLFDHVTDRLYRVAPDGGVVGIDRDGIRHAPDLVPREVEMSSGQHGVDLVVDVPPLLSGEAATMDVTVANTSGLAVEMFLGMEEVSVEFWRDGRRAYPWGVQSQIPASISSVLRPGRSATSHPPIRADVLPGHYELRIALSARFELAGRSFSLPEARSEVIVGGQPNR